MNLMDDLEKAWDEAVVSNNFRKGDVVVYKENGGITAFTVNSPFVVGGPSTFRVHSRATVEVGGDVLAVIAEYKDYPGYGRLIFTRSNSEEGVWLDEEDSRCTLDDLQNIRAVRDEGEYL